MWTRSIEVEFIREQSEQWAICTIYISMHPLYSVRFALRPLYMRLKCFVIQLDFALDNIEKCSLMLFDKKWRRNGKLRISSLLSSWSAPEKRYRFQYNKLSRFTHGLTPKLTRWQNIKINHNTCPTTSFHLAPNTSRARRRCDNMKRTHRYRCSTKNEEHHRIWLSARWFLPTSLSFRGFSFGFAVRWRDYLRCSRIMSQQSTNAKVYYIWKGA